MTPENDLKEDDGRSSRRIKFFEEMTVEEFVNDPAHQALAALANACRALRISPSATDAILCQFQCAWVQLPEAEMRDRYKQFTAPEARQRYEREVARRNNAN